MAAQYSFQFDAGADFVTTLTWLDDTGAAINITGYTAALTMKAKGQEPLVYTQSSSPGLTLGGSTGTIAFDIPGSVTAEWNESVPYTLFLTSSGGIVYKLMCGDFIKAS